jgi:hypothetical protein
MRQLGAGERGVVRTAAQTGLTSTETAQKAACQGREQDRFVWPTCHNHLPSHDLKGL